ncbi:hypothetical protein NS44R_14800, partial [Mammaliicoccus sciuri]
DRRDGDTLADQDGDDPVGRPGAFGRVVNAREWLQRNRGLDAIGEIAAEIVPVAAHAERGGADRAPEVESEDLAAVIATKLQRHDGEQHGLPGSGRADDEGMPDVADMKG